MPKAVPAPKGKAPARLQQTKGGKEKRSNNSTKTTRGRRRREPASKLTELSVPGTRVITNECPIVRGTTKLAPKGGRPQAVATLPVPGTPKRGSHVSV